MGEGHPERPERLAAIEDKLITSRLDYVISRHEAPLATREQLLRVHDHAYLDSLEQIAPSAGMVQIDPDTAMNPHTLRAALRAAGAAVLATDLVISGAAEAAFCAVRPPGHHAERARAMGFCFFNNVAVGAAHALESHGLSRVAIADFDVHHGNGTEDMFRDDPRVLMVSTFEHPFYPGSGLEGRSERMVNVPLPAGAGSREFRAAVEQEWLPALEASSRRCCSSRPASTRIATTVWRSCASSSRTTPGSPPISGVSPRLAPAGGSSRCWKAGTISTCSAGASPCTFRN